MKLYGLTRLMLFAGSVCVLISTARVQAADPVSCSRGALGCKDWHTVMLENGTYQRCSLFAGNYKNFVARSWGCTSSNAIIYNHCNESQYPNDCCIASNNISCATTPAVCPCPPPE